VRVRALMFAGALVGVAVAGCTPKAPSKAASSSSVPASSAASSSAQASTTPATSSTPPPEPSSSQAAPTTAQSLYDADSSGIVRIMDDTCDGFSTGTGFLIGPNLIATVGHVVAGADDIRVTDPVLGTTSSAVVLGFASNDQDLALLQIPVAIPGHIFTLSASEPAVGASIVVIGFSKGGPEHISDGLVESVHQHAAVGVEPSVLTLSDLALTNAATNPGDSGGPWLDAAGQVLALTDYVPPAGDQGENGGGGAGAAGPLV
jgi:S1-C subfamily serine protease